MKEPVSSEGGSPSAPAPSWLYYLSTALAAVIVVCAGTLVYLFLHDTGDGPVGDRVSSLVGGSDDSSGDAQTAEAATADRNAAMAIADQFVLRVNTYGPHDLDKSNKMPAYITRVHQVSTSKLQASFDAGVTLAEQSVSQTGVNRTCTLFGTGISAIGDDTATAMVAGSLGQSYPNKNAPGDVTKRIRYAPVPFRFEVKLVKIDGSWLVDDFTPVTGEDDPSTGTPTQQPTQQPTQRPSQGRTQQPSQGRTRGAGR